MVTCRVQANICARCPPTSEASELAALLISLLTFVVWLRRDSASDMDMSTDDDGDDDEPPARKARFAADSDDDEEDASQSRARADKSGAASSDDEGQEDDDEDPAKLFPLEGKYRDEEDKQR